MAINLANKYEKKVAERFKLKSLTDSGVNKEYDWVGVNAINVYSVPTVAMGDYTASGVNRYGTASELQNTVQTMTLTKDRSFTFTIDKKNNQDTMGVMEAGKALARQIDEVIVPELDAYRLAAMATAAIANSATATEATSASNAYTQFLAATEFLDEKKVPVGGRIAYVNPAFYNFIKLDPTFTKATEIAQKSLINGQVGEIDGVKIIKVPSSYFPANVNFIVCHPDAVVAANKLQDYKTHDNPPGINGQLVNFCHAA